MESLLSKNCTFATLARVPCYSSEEEAPTASQTGGRTRATNKRRRASVAKTTPEKTRLTQTTYKTRTSNKQKINNLNLLIAIFSLTLTVLLIIIEGALGSSSSLSSQQQRSALSGALTSRPDPNGRPQLMVAIYCGGNQETTSAASINAEQRSSLPLYHNQFLDVESRKWRSDRQQTSGASAVCAGHNDKQAILAYCKRVYPSHDIRNIVESSRAYKLDNWCRIGSSAPKRRACRTRLTIRPYRCLEGTFQSDALLVPERCIFDHVHNKSVCASSDTWNKSAGEICQTKTMKLQSYGMLQPCGLDVFSGVEFVCCPATQSSNSAAAAATTTTTTTATATATTTTSTTEGSLGTNSFAQVASELVANSANNDIKLDEGDDLKVSGKRAGQGDAVSSDNSRDSDGSSEQATLGNGGANDDEDEYDEETAEDEADGYDDDSTSWSGSARASARPTTTSTTTTTTTTTTTERPIERYLSHFDLAHEHNDFRNAELAVEASYRDKITHVMHEWSKLDKRYEEMKRKDQPQAAEEFKRKMTHQFQKTVEALEQESAAQRHQLASMHAERAMAIINRRKKAAMDCLTQALDRVPIRARQVERCIVRLLKALEKDRTHTLRQYRNLLNLNTREALQERKIILDHLVTLNRAASQSITMLDRSPVLVDKLKGKIVALWHKLRGVPLGEQITLESEEKTMNQYEEEAAQRQIERERRRLADLERQQQQQQQQASQSETLSNENKQATDASSGNIVAQSAPVAIGGSSDTTSATTSGITSASTSTTSTTTTTTSLPIETTEAKQQQAELQQQAQVVQVTSETKLSDTSASNSQLRDVRTHYQTEPVGFAHLRMDAPYHELSYSVRHEPLHGHMKFGYTTLLASSFAAVILLAFIGVKYYGKNSTRAYRRQGFAEVGRSCPEEKNVTHMQFNGYENPAYKYFEEEA